jgi:hypothetical protein
MSEVSTLRAEVSALAAKVRALESRLLPPVAKPEPVQIVGFERPPNRPLQPLSGFIMPGDKELAQLCSRVRKAYPELNTLGGPYRPQ